MRKERVKLLLGGNVKALFCEVFGRARMIGDRGDGSAELGADLRILGVGVGEAGSVIEDVGGQLVDRVFGHVVAGENDRADGDSDRVGVKTVDVLADGDLGVIRRGLQQLADVLVVQRDEVCLLCGAQIGDRRRAPATMKAASIWPFFRESALSPKDWYVGLMSASVMPYAPSTSMALK